MAPLAGAVKRHFRLSVNKSAANVSPMGSARLPAMRWASMRSFGGLDLSGKPRVSMRETRVRGRVRSNRTAMRDFGHLQRRKCLLMVKSNGYARFWAMQKVEYCVSDFTNWAFATCNCGNLTDGENQPRITVRFDLERSVLLHSLRCFKEICKILQKTKRICNKQRIIVPERCASVS